MNWRRTFLFLGWCVGFGYLFGSLYPFNAVVLIVSTFLVVCAGYVLIILDGGRLK